MVESVLDFDLVGELGQVGVGMGAGYGLLGVEEFSGLVLNQVDEGVSTNAD